MANREQISKKNYETLWNFYYCFNKFASFIPCAVHNFVKTEKQMQNL